MFCPNCGTQLSDTASFCKGCGTALGKNNATDQSPPPRLVGFSPRINDPSFTKYKGKSAAWPLIFASILFVVAVPYTATRSGR